MSVHRVLPVEGTQPLGSSLVGTTTSPGLTRVRWVAIVAPVRRLKMATSSVSGERQGRLRFLIDGKDAIGIDKDGKGMP